MTITRSIALLGLTSLVLSGITACSKKVDPPEQKPRPVIAFTVGEPQASIERSFSGLLEPATGAGIAFEVSGRIIEIIAKRGVSYKKGDVLARLDPVDYKTDLAGAQAELTEAMQSKARTQTLFESDNASKSELEAAVAKERGARTRFESAKKKVDDCTLKMPYDGTVASVPADTQAVVSSGQEVITLQGAGAMEFVIGVPADEVANLKIGMASEIVLGSLPGKALSGSITEIGSEPSDNSTYPVELTLSGDTDPAARAGMDGEAKLTLPNKNGAAILIPIECVAGRGQGTEYVWILEGDGATRKVVKRDTVIGNLAPNGMIEIKSGLQPGELVVSRGVHRIEAGSMVAISEQK